MTEAQQQQRYRVVERLAAGGMAEVFLAESAGIEGFKKQVAIKRVLPALSEKKRFIAMFLDEARLSATLSHSNVAQVFDIGRGDSAYFIVMEYVDGADLKAVIEYLRNAGRVFPVEAACFIASKICEGLTYAHELKGTDGVPLSIVHRDMSPPNVLITKHGEIKIVDFGLAKAASQLEKSEAGIIKGKFGYLSPEAAQGQEIDLRTDIFAVGIILWELLAGQRLFFGETDFGTVQLVQEAKIPSLKAINPLVPIELERILARALAREPDKRYASARDLGRDLTTFLYKFGKPVSAYDVAEIVREAMSHKQRSQPDRVSIIDKLIEEALLEFTSLQDDAKPAAQKGGGKAAGPAPVTKGFEDIGNWADEIEPAPGPAAIAKKSAAVKIIEEGNLASLEDSLPNIKAVDDDDEKPPASVKPPAAKASTEAPAPAKAAVSKPAAAALVAPAPISTKPEAGGGSGKIIGVVVVVIAIVAGLWFGGVIPH